MEDYRFDEIADFNMQVNGLNFKLIYSIRRLVKINSILSLARMIFITILMGISLLQFESSTMRLVVNPIERMLEKVRLIARNPLAAA